MVAPQNSACPAKVDDPDSLCEIQNPNLNFSYTQHYPSHCMGLHYHLFLILRSSFPPDSDCCYTIAVHYINHNILLNDSSKS